MILEAIDTSSRSNQWYLPKCKLVCLLMYTQVQQLKGRKRAVADRGVSWC